MAETRLWRQGKTREWCPFGKPINISSLSLQGLCFEWCNLQKNPVLMPPWSQGPGGGRTSAVGILGNVCSCMKELETNQPRSEAGRQGKPWFMYQHILFNIRITGSEGITCYLLAEKEEKGRHKGRKNYSLMQLV